MKVLIVEDEYTSQMQLEFFLEGYGDCEFAFDGDEAVDKFMQAFENEEPFDLICLDIKLPKQDGHDVLKQIRNYEKQQGLVGKRAVKVFITTALSNFQDVRNAYYELCDEYVTKPVEKEKIIELLKTYKLIDI